VSIFMRAKLLMWMPIGCIIVFFFIITVSLCTGVVSAANEGPPCGLIVDINKDTKTGLEETIFALQATAEIRKKYDAEEVESNNTLEDATKINLNEKIGGTIGVLTAGSPDLFKFDLPSPGVIEICVTPESPGIALSGYLLDAELALLDNAQAIKDSGVSEPGGTLTMKTVCEAGAYFFMLNVGGIMERVDIGYALLVEQDKSDVYEFNNSFANSASIPIETIISAKIEGEGDKDYFKFTTSQPGVIEVLINPPPNLLLKAYLYDSDQEQITYAVASEVGGMTVLKELIPAGEYYLKVYDDDRFGNDFYTFKIISDNSDSYEMNNTFVQAREVPLNTGIVAKIKDEGDCDYYKFTTLSSGTVEITVDPSPSNIKMFADLYNSDSNRLVSKSAIETGAPLFISVSADSGQYFLKLYSDNSSSSDEPYTLSIRQ